jgi:TRAP-type mannitol/chloroaromatic compound transport system substrate-binding protein
MIERRRFLAKASGAVAAVAAATIIDAPKVIAQPKVQWRMSTAFPPALDIQKTASELLAKIVDETTAGRFRIEVFPGGQIMPPFDCFEAAGQGKIDAYYGQSYYWAARELALEFGFNKKAYEALPVDLKRTLDHAVAAVHVYSSADFHVKNSIALERLKAEFKGKVEITPLPRAVLRNLKKLSTEVVKEESEKSPMARKVHASYTKFQALIGPWDHVAEGAYHQFVGGTS